jgi:hypothetical protein
MVKEIDALRHLHPALVTNHEPMNARLNVRFNDFDVVAEYAPFDASANT